MTNTQTLHQQALEKIRENDFTSAATLLEQARAQNKNDIDIMQHLANVYRHLGKTMEAMGLYRKIIEEHPDFAPTYNNLGVLYHILGKDAEALQQYQKAINRQDDYLEAYYNMGQSLLALKRFPEAENAFSAVIKKDALNARAHYQLGKLFFLQRDYKKALEHFAVTRQIYVDEPELYLNLGHCCLELKEPSEAERYYKAALEFLPADASIYFNLGVVAEHQRAFERAMKYYQEALARQPDYFEACNNIGVLMLRTQNLPRALEYFKRALVMRPSHVSTQYIIDMISQDKRLEAAPTEYVKELFDSYADLFEQHVRESLYYKIPEELFSLVRDECSSKDLSIIDLGCGTGLCGPLFSPMAQELVGVDLSPNMLSIAREKKVYTELVAEDFLIYLQKRNDDCDLIIAADVFVYIGRLNTVFERCARALRPGGLFAFSVEASWGEGDFVSHASGRFSHTQDYLMRLADAYGMHVLNCREVVSREQRGQPVFGFVVLLRKSHVN